MTYTSKPITAEEAFNELLERIDSNKPLVLLPLRLETHFREGDLPAVPVPGGDVTSGRTGVGNERRRELCVRIFPDEIFVNYWREEMTRDEYDAGRWFWMQWFIASGSEKREYEAWQVLCRKYPVAHAAWIARKTRLKDLNRYRTNLAGSDGSLFYRRPYTRLANVDEACDDIYANLAKVVLDQSLKKDPYTGEYLNEKDLRTNLSKIKDDLHNIDRDLVSCEVIVDYLYDKIDATIKYLAKRLRNYRSFYDRYPGLYADNRRVMEAWDMDYTILKSMQEEVRIFQKKLRGKRISLDDLVRRYLDDPKNDVFPDVKLVENHASFAPTVDLLPDQFLLIAEPMDKTKEKVYVFSNPVNKSIKVVPDPETLADNVKIDSFGAMKVDRELRWMTDYDQAWADGMAITLPLDKDDTAFRYIYVLGVRKPSGHDTKDLEKLFGGHNYLGEGMSFIDNASPTNLVEGGAGSDVLSLEDGMRIRYEIEVNDIYNVAYDMDANDLAKGLSISGMDCLYHVPDADADNQRKARIATRALWDRVRNNLRGDNPEFEKFFDFIGTFLEENVRSTGPLPMIRIGNVPYGFLPVTDHERVFATMNSSDDAMLRILYDTLLGLGSEWKRLRNEKVVAAERLAGAEAEKDFLSMIGQTPQSVEVYERKLMDSPLMPERQTEAENALQYLAEGKLFRSTPVLDACKVSSLEDLKACVREAFKQRGLEADDAEVERLVCEFMDLFTYRLDAWFTGMAWYLHQHPERTDYNHSKPVPALGAYGWVFNLSENKNAAGEKDKGEFIFAPSLQHALTAAVLRAAYLNTQKDAGDPHMCINLSSMRSRAALRMIQGLRDGMSTGTVLGADLERYLHDAYKSYGDEMDEFIYPMRKLFPLTLDIQAQNTEKDRPQASNYMMQVINGEALLNTFLSEWHYDGRLAGWLEKNAPKLEWYKALKDAGVPVERKGKTLFQLIERMYDSYDALNDLLLAEGVHRLVLNDSASFEAIAKFMARGSGNLPDPAILQTPMDYYAVAHKTGVAIPTGARGEGFMGKAEPGLDAWLKSLTDGMDHISLDVAYSTEPGGEPRIWPETLASLDIHPLEYLYLSGNENAFRTLLEYRWRCREGIMDGIVKILTGNPEENAAGEVPYHQEGFRFSLYEDSLRIDSLRALLARSRAMTVSDWDPAIVSDAEIERCQDVGELRDRFLDLYASCNNLHRDMAEFFRSYNPEAGLSDQDIAKALSLKADCISTGFAEAADTYPMQLSLHGVDKITQRVQYDEVLARQKDFMEQFSRSLAALGSRVAEAGATASTASDVKDSVKNYCQAIRKLTLDSFVVVPRFRPVPMLQDEQRRIFESGIRSVSGYYDMTDSDVADWCDEVGAVHPGMHLWNQIMMFQELSGTATLEDEEIVILQKRSDNNYPDRWMGKPMSEKFMCDADSLVLFGKKRVATLRPESLYAGIVFDNWIEYIPGSQHTAGMVFRCDQPDAEAPQTVLLAEFPELNSREHTCWDLGHVQNILDSTRFQIQNRAVDPDMIYNDPKLSKIFPLLSDAILSLPDIDFIYTSGVAPAEVRERIRKAVWQGIFDYMPGGQILKEFLNNDNYHDLQ